MKKTAVHTISFVALLTVMAKALGMLRDILQARAFGASAEMDLYTSASNFTVYIFSAVAYALCIAAVAVIGGHLAKSRADAEKCANRLISLCLICSLAAAAVIVILAVSGAFGGWHTGAFPWYIAVLSLSLPVIVVTYMFMALFQTLGHYSVQGSLSLLYNIVLCIILFAFGKNMSVPHFAVCMSAAWLLQCATLVPCFVKEKYRFRFGLSLKDPDTATFAKTAAATLFTTSAFLLCYLCDSAQSAGAEEGVVSAFYYADKLFTPLVTTVIYSISAVMFPRWSEKSKTMDDRQFGGYVVKAVENTVLFLLPVSAAASAFGTPMIRVLFEGGSFSRHSAQVTGAIFSCYAFGMVGFALLDLLAKGCYASGRLKAPLLVNIGVVVLNPAVNFAAVSLGAPHFAPAAGTAVLMTAGGAILAYMFCRRTGGRFSPAPIIKSTLLSAVMYGALRLLSAVFINAVDSKIILVLKCGIMGAAALAVYALIMKKHLAPPKKDGGQHNAAD